MENEFNIYMDQRIVGKALCIRQGMFYRIHAQCNFRKEGRYTVMAKGDLGEIDLGLCVPSFEGYSLSASIPLKCIGNEIQTFIAKSKDTEYELIKFDPDTLFEAIEELRYSRLVMDHGIEKIRFEKDHMLSSNPTGQ